MSNSTDPHRILQRAPWYQDKRFIRLVLLASLATLLASVLTWAVAAIPAISRRRAPAQMLPAPMLAARKAARWAASLALAPWLLYLAVALVIMNDMLFVSTPACALLLRLDQALAWLAVAAAAIAIWAASVSLRTPQVASAIRVHYVLLALACVGSAAMTYLGGLLAWNGQY